MYTTGTDNSNPICTNTSHAGLNIPKTIIFVQHILDLALAVNHFHACAVALVDLAAATAMRT